MVTAAIGRGLVMEMIDAYRQRRPFWISHFPMSKSQMMGGSRLA
jgi:hypothetical protein